MLTDGTIAKTDALVVENVTKTFSAVRAVDALSANVPTGCIYGFLGPNGAGKTTTIRMIMDIIRPDSGRIEVLGRDSTKLTRERIGYMPEERGLYRKMSVQSVLWYIAGIKGMKRNEIVREVPRWLEAFDLTDWTYKKVEELSRGMQQKVQFIATVINRPEFLILDEPFSGLDPVNLDVLKEIMLRMRDEGKTVIFSTHMMEQAEKLCDYILLINRGAKVIDGRLDEIKSRYRTDAVHIEVEGDVDFVDHLPIVQKRVPSAKGFDVFLKKDADPQELLKALVGKVRVSVFQVKVPSLHEIFIQLVGNSNG